MSPPKEREAVIRPNVELAILCCFRCRDSAMASTPHTSITVADMHALAARRGGKCLSLKYVNTDFPLLWQCAAGHQWRARPAKIKKGQWCRICAGYAKRTIEEMQAYAQSRGGKCLSSAYKGLGTPLEWECAAGHRWPARPGNVLHLNTWCPYCAGRIVTREELADLAAARGGELLSPVYLGAQRLHRWRCCDGHDFEATPNRVKNGGWCPRCQIYYGEEISRLFMEAIFDAAFPRSFPAFLREADNRSWLQLDGYNEQLLIAFEHHGLQHYQRVPQFHRTAEEFAAQQERDAQKAELCRAHGVRLVVIPAVPDLTSLENLPAVIAQQAATLGMALPRDPMAVRPDLNQVFCVSQYAALQQLAAARGGALLSKAYLGGAVKLLWRCRQGHEWEAKPNSVKSGTWCRECAGITPTEFTELMQIAAAMGFQITQDNWALSTRQARVLELMCIHKHVFHLTPKQLKRKYRCPQCVADNRITIDNARALAIAREGACLSTGYVNSQSLLLWRCKEGHEWEASYASISRGSWCRVCSMRDMGVRKRKYTLDDMILHARSRGGECLSTEMTTVDVLLSWRCARGHEWDATAASVVSAGTWCEACARQRVGISQRCTLSEMQEVAASRGGECLSLEYLDNQTHLLWRCKEGHQWSATPNNIKRGKWCPYCAGKARLTIEQMREIAAARGGKCLSDKYTKSDDKLQWECAEGHRWEATPESVKGYGGKGGSWCPLCARRKAWESRRKNVGRSPELG